MTPFREAAPDENKLALARLEARPTHPIRWAIRRYAWFRPARSARALPADVRSAEAAGFQRLGAMVEGYFPRYVKETWVDPARTTQCQLSTRGYHFATYFRTGKAILTWNHVPQTPSTSSLQSRATLGSFTQDYEAHVAAVAALGDEPIVVTDVDTAVRLGRLYYQIICPLGLALMALAGPLIIVATLAWAVWGIVMHRRR